MSASDRAPSSSRVLFADDDRSVRNAFARTLRAAGYIVDLAADGVEALNLAREYPYAVVITDHQMPELSGLELIGCLRALQPDSSFLLVTAFSDVAARARAEEGVHGALLKPWRDGELLPLVARCIAESNRRKKERRADTVPSIPAYGEFVLVVEPDEARARAVKALFDYSEYRIVLARRFEEAMEFLKARNYTAVLANLKAADVSPMAFLAELQAIAPQTPIVVLAEGHQDALGQRALKAGAQDYVCETLISPEAAIKLVSCAVERKRIEGRLAERAHYDELTRLANRSLLKDRMDQAAARAIRFARPMALVSVDLDQFKGVNDTHGHDAGDQLLVEVSRRLLGSTRTEDTVARTGGDEFSILLEDLDGVAGARRVAQRILNAFATPIVFEDKVLQITPSVGVALYPEDVVTVSDLVRAADSALYSAKEAGKNRFHLFGDELGIGVAEHMSLRHALSRALESGGFSLLYQPEMDVRQGLVLGYEALLRCSVREGRQLSACEFLPILEESRLLGEVGRWVFREACEQSSKLGLGHGGRVSINVSARQFYDRDFVAEVRAAMVAAGARVDLEVEVREAVLSKDLGLAQETIVELESIGVSVAIDDFGMGKTSLVDLATLPLRTAKLYKGLVANLHQAETKRVVGAIIAAGGALGWRVVAAGVETEAQYRVLQELGCPFAQGYLFGRPSRPGEHTESIRCARRLCAAALSA